MTRPDELRIRDISECIEAIANSRVLLDSMPPNPALATTVIDAVTHRLMIIGEAVKGLSPEFLTQHPDVPWRDMMRLRDLIGHHYYKLDTEIIWATIDEPLEKLTVALSPYSNF